MSRRLGSARRLPMARSATFRQLTSYVSNSAARENGGIFSTTNPVQAINSIVAGNVSPGGDVDTGLTAGSTNNILGVDPNLGALADNGGPTPTMLPLAGRPIIDAGSDANCPATDQRGVHRPQGAHCDIGAVELVADRLFADNFDGTQTP